MKAAIMDRYGSAEVFRIGELPLPEPGRREVRIAVRAASVNPIDWRIRSGSLRLVYPIRRPAVLGFDAAGVVDAVGEGVEGLSIGDNVYTRLDTRAGGAYGEAVVTPASAVARMPEGLGFEEAASLPLAALTAIQALRDVAGGVNRAVHVEWHGEPGRPGTLRHRHLETRPDRERVCRTIRVPKLVLAHHKAFSGVLPAHGVRELSPAVEHADVRRLASQTHAHVGAVPGQADDSLATGPARERDPPGYDLIARFVPDLCGELLPPFVPRLALRPIPLSR